MGTIGRCATTTLAVANWFHSSSYWSIAVTYVYKSDQHECKPPTIGDRGRYADAPVGSVWKCGCGKFFVVGWFFLDWHPVDFWDFAAKRRIKEYERSMKNGAENG